MDPNIHQAKRVIVGHCPECQEVIVVLNNGEVWPLVECRCGWAGATTDMTRIRFERGGVVKIAS